VAQAQVRILDPPDPMASWPVIACPYCRRRMPQEPHTGTLHTHTLPKRLRPGFARERLRCPASPPPRRFGAG